MTTIRDIFFKSFFLHEDLRESELDTLLKWVDALELPQQPDLASASLAGVVQAVETLQAQNDNVFRGSQTIQEVSQITNDAGLFVAGEFRVGNGAAPGAGFTGGRYGWPGFTYDGTTYFLVGVDNDVLQVGLSLEDGKIYAGAGAVVVDINGIAIYEQAGDVNGQVIFHNDALPNNFGGLTMYDENFMRLYYHDDATGQSSAVRVDKDNVSAHVNTRFLVVDEPSGNPVAALYVTANAEGLKVYDSADGTTELAEILRAHWAMKAVTATPAYRDEYARLYLYDNGISAAELRLRIKYGSAERQFVLGSSTGIIETTDFLHINGVADQDTVLRFREASVTQGKLWYDASENNFSIENEISGGDILAVLKGGAPTTENFVVWDRTAGVAVFSVPNDFGWLAASQTWTYASATTFTVAGDVTGIYQQGTKVRWVQSNSQKYGVVKSSSYSSPNTTVTLYATSDYSVANSAITANYYSYIENPQSFPDWFNWTPGFTGFSSDPPTPSCQWRVSGKTGFLSVSTSTGTSNSVNFTITGCPVTPASVTFNLPWGSAVDNGAALTGGGRIALAASGTITPRTNFANGAWTNAGGKAVNFNVQFPLV